MEWEVQYESELVGAGESEGFFEWWAVIKHKRSFRCDTEENAEWLRDVLNNEERKEVKGRHIQRSG